jgi:hypothetical protein
LLLHETDRIGASAEGRRDRHHAAILGGLRHVSTGLTNHGLQVDRAWIAGLDRHGWPGEVERVPSPAPHVVSDPVDDGRIDVAWMVGPVTPSNGQLEPISAKRTFAIAASNVPSTMHDRPASSWRPTMWKTNA